MRGKGAHIAPRKRYQRITPAYAGKSELHAQGPPATMDHPRVCGEKTKKIP